MQNVATVHAKISTAVQTVSWRTSMVGARHSLRSVMYSARREPRSGNGASLNNDLFTIRRGSPQENHMVHEVLKKHKRRPESTGL